MRKKLCLLYNKLSEKLSEEFEKAVVKIILSIHEEEDEFDRSCPSVALNLSKNRDQL